MTGISVSGRLEEDFFRRLPQHPLSIIAGEKIEPVSHQLD